MNFLIFSIFYISLAYLCSESRDRKFIWRDFIDNLYLTEERKQKLKSLSYEYNFSITTRYRKLNILERFQFRKYAKKLTDIRCERARLKRQIICSSNIISSKLPNELVTSIWKNMDVYLVEKEKQLTKNPFEKRTKRKKRL